ncbi:MAG: glycosyltransferase [Kiritimatiellia bacterium]|jgi:glycosyltransferase involved in cell wall biosynthesis
MLLSCIIPTKNEEAHIATSVASLRPLVDAGVAEVIVVDNASTDRTRELAREAGARVFEQGPERSAQRNRGAREAAGEFLLFLDADMILPEATGREIVGRLSAPDAPDALWVREIRTGSGLRVKARNFERSFYDATCIDAFRVIRRAVFGRSGGYDESLWAAEDWDLDRRVLAVTSRVALTDGHLLHDEARLTLRRVLRKKAYYAGSFAAYRTKWNNDAIVRKQFGAGYRFFGVFVENGKWRRVLRHPILFATMMVERACVGFTYLRHR